MRNFFNYLFKSKKKFGQKRLSILNASNLQKIEDYIVDNGGFTIRLLSFDDDISISGYSFHDAFDSDAARESLKKIGLKNSLDLLNTTYRKLGITELSEEAYNLGVENGLEYWYLDISFQKAIPISQQTNYKTQPHRFIIFMINLDGGIYNGFRIMHSDQFFFDYTEDFYNAVKIDIDNIIDEKQNLAVDEIEKVVYAICKTIAIEVPENLQNPEWDKLLINKAELKHYEELLRLTTRNNYDVSAYIKDAEKLFRYYNKGKSKEEIHLDFTTTLEEYFIKENEVCVHETTFFSDWKFDAESMEWGISKMINTDFTFAYPEDTYSHDLFPFIQEELDKNALELMNLDTYGDSYLFFVAHKNEVNRIIELAQIIGLGIEKI